MIDEKHLITSSNNYVNNKQNEARVKNIDDSLNELSNNKNY